MGPRGGQGRGRPLHSAVTSDTIDPSIHRRTVFWAPVFLAAVFDALSQVPQNDQIVLQCASPCPAGANNGVLLIARTTARASCAR